MSAPSFTIGYVVIYRNDDQTFSPGRHVHRERQCAIDAIPADENREVLRVAEIYDVVFDRQRPLIRAQVFKAHRAPDSEPFDAVGPLLP